MQDPGLARTHLQQELLIWSNILYRIPVSFPVIEVLIHMCASLRRTRRNICWRARARSCRKPLCAIVELGLGSGGNSPREETAR
jgi:hypothetical protein